MFKRVTKVTSIVVLLAVMAITATVAALAAPARQGMMACAQDYNVQADDWLSKLAEKQYGDPLAYPAIVDATNEAAQTDSSFATITNPNVIEVGWKLCLPATADTAMMMGETGAAESMAMAGESGAMTAGESGAMTGNESGAMMEGESGTMTAGESGTMMEGESGAMTTMGEKTRFTVRIENVAGLAGETGLVSPLAPGVWAVHTTETPLFTTGQPDRGQGLEALAEDGDPSALAASVANEGGIVSSGVFNTPAGATEPGILLPGHTYEFSFEAAPGENLSLATMFVQSNDLFYAPDSAGIALFDAAGNPITGDITNQVSLWDAGTEVNQAPGSGPDQAPRQAGLNTGAAENGVVQPVADQFSYPATADIIRVTISAGQ